jgi:hypothetical protein
VTGAACGSCRAALTPGAKFCHRCGTAVGAAPVDAGAHGLSAALPWSVAGISLLALIALLAGQRFAAGRTPAASATPDFAAAGGADDGSTNVRAPDISAMSPRDRADRLFNRIMLYHEQGKADSVQFFAPMALAAYQMAAPLDADQHYHLGRIGLVAGAAELARSEADSILRTDPDHLLGLSLAAGAARLTGDEQSARAFDRRLLAAEPGERRKGLPEYAQHRNDIEAATAAAKRR